MAAVKTPTETWFIIDFDSTFTQVEALDELCTISLDGKEERDTCLSKIKQLTDEAMDGEIGFGEALEKRIELLKAHKDDLPELIERLKGQVSKSIQRNTAFFDKYSDKVLIVSNGFKEFIEPIVADYGIKAENVYANEFVFDEEGNIVGVHKDNPLSQDEGKVKLFKELKLPGDVYVIGDGFTDYQIKAAGLANRFYAFTENVERDVVVEKADGILPSFDEFLYQHKLPMSISYPKSRIRVLLLENIHQDAADIFQGEGYQVERVAGAMDEEELCEKIKNVSIIGIRSKTHITEKVLKHANRLIAVGAFCIGTNQIDLEACSRKGVAVFNAPYSNTRSVVELAVSEIVMLMRRLPHKIMAMHQGEWRKSAKGAHEIRGKKLGIIGYGNIGSQLSVVAEAMGMEVYFYDLVDRLPMGNAKQVLKLEDMLGMVDVVTLHIDGRPSNKAFFGENEFKAMKPGSFFLNLGRGNVIQTEPLVEALKSGHLAGAGVDVFPEEPKTKQAGFQHPLQGLENVIMTPHIGGSTEEAQEDIGNYVPGKLIDYVNSGNTFGSVNFPNLQLPVLRKAHRLLHIHQNKAGVLAQINDILSKHQTNIQGQYLQTNEEIGYVITDIDKAYDKEIIKALRKIDGTIKFRVLY